MNDLCWLLVLCVLLWPAPARAVIVEPQDGPCPIGGGFVRVFQLVSQNSYGGWDSDGARYSSRGQFRAYELSTCPDNLLTLYGTDMATELTEAEKRALRRVLEQIVSEVPDPRSLTVWDRYRIAARCYQALGRDHLFIARLYTKGAWTVRDHAVGFYQGLEGPLAVRFLLEAGPKELEKTTESANRHLLLLNLARVAHRGGYPDLRDHWMAQLEAQPDLTDPDREAMDRLATAARAEPDLQDLAIGELEAFLGGRQGTAEERVEGTFLLGDLLRRRGRNAEALARFEEVQATAEAPESLVVIAAYLSAELRGERPWVGRSPGDLTPGGPLTNPGVQR
ncbi:MAG: hypothetical protein JRJ84_16855 [Deltaproteobacteria bacterium]|nr:hypothetical protein [Deltaproteobacteria bacterium]